jgi:rubrerythrin
VQICGKEQKMKIEDAIRRYESWAEDDRIDALIRKEHRQIADWLKELNTDRPQGEWVHSHKDTIAEGLYCSNCGKHGYGEKFCPNCGAKMRESN